MDDVKEGPQFVYFVEFASQCAGQIKAKAVDVHFQNPVAQAVHNELKNARMDHVEGIAAAGIVDVVTPVV